MNNFGFTLSQDLDFDDPEVSQLSKFKHFNYFGYPSEKIKQKPFSTFDYSLDDSMNIVLEQTPTENNKYDEIIERQEKLIDLLKDENTMLKDKVKQLEQNQASHQIDYNPMYQQNYPQILRICYLLNLDINNQYLYPQIYQSVENVMTQLAHSQNRVKQLEKKSRDIGLQRVNSTTYLQKSGVRDYKNKRIPIQYRQKQETHVQKLQKQVSELKKQCEKLKKSMNSTPLFVPSIKQKKVEMIVQKIIEKQKIIQKIVEIPKEKIVQVQKIVEKIIQKQVPVYFQKKVKQQVPVYIDKIIQKVNPIYIDRQIQVQKVVYIQKNTDRKLQSKSIQTESQ